MSIINIFKKKAKKKIHEKIDCPRCHKKMRQITKHNITIDVCKECEGMWLDKGEIEQLTKLKLKLQKEEKK